MKVEKLDGSTERRIAIAMVVDKTALGRIATKWDKEGLFKNEWANIVGSWCVKFFRKYDKAPAKAIEGMFETWSQEGKDKATVSLVEKFLSSLSDEYKTLAKESNSDYITDLAATHFNKVKLLKLAEALQGDVDLGAVDKALSKVHSFGKVEIGVGAGIDVMQDENAIREAFDSKSESLIDMPGDLGKFMGYALERDGFIALLASEKKGKSWVLVDMSWRAMLQRRKVAFFAVGDMSQNQMLRRFMVRAAKHPMREGIAKIPTSLSIDEDTREVIVDHKEQEFKGGLDWKAAFAACKEIMEVKAKSKESLLKLSVHPNSTLNVSGIISILQTWERDGWIPDVIIIDYADILAPPTGVAETRDQINMTWKQLRSLSQSHHCLVITATQADAASYKVETIDRSNFSEDKRKLAHVTGMIGLNATKEEKDMGVLRLNWIVLREQEYSEGRCCVCAGCLSIGNPFMKTLMQ